MPASLIALAGALLAIAPASAEDLLIENASVVDGTGAGARTTDVRIRGDRIVAIGALDPQRGETVIDARGLTLAPGFIDTHSHHASGLAGDPGAAAVVSQGVTTIVAGQDGGSVVPLSGFFKTLEAKPAAINVASYSGHNSLRGTVLGQDFKRRATSAEVEKMRMLLADDMAAGALGLSTGLEYDPGIYSDKGEVLTLAGEAARHGGRYISHLRSEDRDVWAALDELVEIGRKTGMPVQVSHAKLAMTDWWGQADRYLAVLDKARVDGIDATLDVYPYPYWHSTLTVLWPERNFGDRPTADFILKHLVPAKGLLIAGFPPDPGLAGKTVAAIALQRGTDEVSTLMALVDEIERAKSGANVIATSMDERDIAKFVAWPHANFSSDGAIGGRHPRGAGAFTRALRIYVRETGLLTIEQAIHKMTALSAAHMGLKDRGVIRAGAFADLVLFDPKTVTDRATTDDPTALSDGIARVWVNGALVFNGGKSTGAHPGRALRREGTAAR
ncbi:MAG: N-acyl-D-amino-acid deacylase family protein [Sphingobium sp.]